MTYSKQECLKALRKAKNNLGHSPGYTEYKQTDLLPSVSAIEKKLGSFNEAKREAGLETNPRGQQPKPINESYFKQIDTTEKAYWLGFITGDGCVQKENPTDKFTIELQSKDRNHLVKLQKAIDSGHDLTTSNGGVQFSVQNQEFVDGLLNHGAYYDKTFNGGVPDLKEKLKQPFVRGLFDADGTLSLDYNWRIAGSNLERLKGLQSWIPVDSDIRKTNTCFSLVVTGKYDDKPKLLSWLYPYGRDTKPALKRKKKQTKEFHPYW
jgi:hypothetical protein